MKLFNFFHSTEWKLLWPFYVQNLIRTMFFFYGPFSVIYFIGVGLTFKQISLLIAILLLVGIVFEIPTGAIADIFGRKISVILSYVLAGLAILSVAFTNNFGALVIIFILWAVFRTLGSGADDAWIVDLLKKNGMENRVHDYFIKIQSTGSLGVIFMGLLAALSVKYFGITSIWIVTGISTILASFILLFAKEHFSKKKIHIGMAFKKTIEKSKESLKYSIKSKELLFLLIAVFFFVLGTQSWDVVWQPFITGLGLKTYQLGYVFSFISVILIGIPFLSKPILKKFGKEKYYLATLVVAEAALLLLVSLVSSVLMGVLMMVLLNIVYELESPVNSKFFQRIIPTKMRATLGSLKSMITGTAAAVGILIAGVIADLVGPKMTIVYSAFFMVPAIYFYLRIRENGKKNPA